MTYFNTESNSFLVASSIPTKQENRFDADGKDITVEVTDESFILIDDKPSDEHYWDGSTWLLKAVDPLTTSELKEIGLPYTLNGVEYQIPLNEEAQNGVVAVTVQQMAGLFTSTVFHFSNGVKMPIADADWLAFAIWFGVERNKFFNGEIV